MLISLNYFRKIFSFKIIINFFLNYFFIFIVFSYFITDKVMTDSLNRFLFFLLDIKIFKILKNYKRSIPLFFNSLNFLEKIFSVKINFKLLLNFNNHFSNK
jgi:hypothetical protein